MGRCGYELAFKPLSVTTILRAKPCIAGIDPGDLEGPRKSEIWGCDIGDQEEDVLLAYASAETIPRLLKV